MSQAPFRLFSGRCYRVRRAARAWAARGTSGWCVHGSVAAGTDTHADCQLITLQNEGSAGERWSMGAGLAPPQHGIRTFGEKRARKGSGNVAEPEQPVLTRAAHRSCSLLAGRALCLKAEDPSKLKRLCVDPSPAPATINSAVCPAGAEFNKLRSEIL